MHRLLLLAMSFLTLSQAVISTPTHRPVHSYGYDYTCVAHYPSGAMRTDDGVIINFPNEKKSLEVGFVNDGFVDGFGNCSMANSDKSLIIECTYLSKYTFKIFIKPDLSGYMAEKGQMKQNNICLPAKIIAAQVFNRPA